MAEKLTRESAWKKFHELKRKADSAIEKLSDFATELGYPRLADGFYESMTDNYDVLKYSILEEKFGSDPEEED